nr:MAG TPA: hypothetical protein [Caudoviricetes sp.]
MRQPEIVTHYATSKVVESILVEKVKTQTHTLIVGVSARQLI